MTGPVLLGTAAGVMVSLLFYALLVTEPPSPTLWASWPRPGSPVGQPSNACSATGRIVAVTATRSGAPRRRHRGSPAAGGWTGWTGPRACPTPSKSSARIYGTHRLFSDAHRLGDGRQTVTSERRRPQRPGPLRCPHQHGGPLPRGGDGTARRCGAATRPLHHGGADLHIHDRHL
jgi:hypothetical protein